LYSNQQINKQTPVKRKSREAEQTTLEWWLRGIFRQCPALRVELQEQYIKARTKLSC